MKAKKSEKVPQGCEFNVGRRTLPVGLPDLSQESFGGISDLLSVWEEVVFLAPLKHLLICPLNLEVPQLVSLCSAHSLGVPIPIRSNVTCVLINPDAVLSPHLRAL